MSDGPKDDKPRPRPRRSAPDLRVLSAAIVEKAQEAPAAAEPVEAPAAVVEEDFEVLAPAQRRAPVLLIAGGVVLAVVILAVTLAASLRGGGKKKSGATPAQTAVVKTEAPVAATGAGAEAGTGAEPEIEIEPAKTEPAKTEPAKTEPAKTEPAKTEPAKTEPAKTEPAKDRDDHESSSSGPAPVSSAKRRADAELAYRDGVQLAAVGDNAGAVKALKRAAAGNPGHAPTWRALGDVYVKRGDKGSARTAYQRYLKLAPKAGDADKVRNRLRAL